jgi:hypothetical protein
MTSPTQSRPSTPKGGRGVTKGSLRCRIGPRGYVFFVTKDFHARNPADSLLFKRGNPAMSNSTRLGGTMLDRLSNPLSVSVLFFPDSSSGFWVTESIGQVHP